jgi:TPR repeat protein
MRWMSLGIVLALAAACADPSSKPTVTVCKGSACHEQDKSVVTYDPASAVPDPDPDGRLASLEALARDDPSAAYDLGLRLFRGDGVRQDSYQALKWMRDAAERGDRQAQTAVGRLYYTGLEEMGSDLREAEKWLSAAAGYGDKEADALLAEVRKALASDEAYRRQLASLRATTYYWWYRGWSYRWYWDPYRRTYLGYY